MAVPGLMGESFSHYRITGTLGQGGMGVVYLAEDTLLGRRVAIKFPHCAAGDSHSRLLGEARAASSLTHPCIAAIYDCGEYLERPYVVMELVEGRSLAELLEQGPLPVPRAVEIAAHVARALEAAHAAGIVHRDIKPANIRIDPRGAVKVVDFGLAKMTARAQVAAGGVSSTHSPTQTVTGTISGTPQYMSPEQARGESGDVRSDVFALGAVLYECLAGRPPFSGPTVMDVLSQVLQREPPPPSRLNAMVPAALDRITEKALAKDPAGRYQTAAELLEALALPRRRIVWPRRWAAIAAAMVALAVPTTWLLTRSSSHPPDAEALRWYAEGANAIRDATYFKASKALERAADLDPRFALAHARLAEAWNELDDAARSREEMLKAVTAGTGQTALSPLDRLTVDAISRSLTGDTAAAVQLYREIVRRTKAADEQASAWLDLGRAWERDENAREALASYQEAARRSSQYAAAFLRLGVLNARRQNFAEADRAFSDAETRYRALSNIEGLIQVIYQRGVIANERGRTTEAGELLGRALAMAREGGSVQQQIVAQLQLSNLDYQRGEPARAEQRAAEAIELARSNGLEGLAVRGIIDLGNAYFVAGDRGQARRHYEQALTLARRFRAPHSEARALLMLGSVALQENRIGDGLRYLEQGLPFYEKGGYRKERSQALILLGRARRDQGDYEGALKAFTQQLDSARQAGDWAQQTLALESIAHVLLFQERYPEALARSTEHLELARAHGNELAAAYGLLLHSEALAALGRYGEVEKQLDELEQIATRPGGYSALAAAIGRGRAELALGRGQYAIARARARAALDRAADDDQQRIEAGCILARADAMSGHAAAATAASKQALELARKMGVPRLLGRALLADAEARAAAGQASAALAEAREAQQEFARAGQRESEARAWLIQAPAARAMSGAAAGRELASNSERAFAAFQQGWSAEDRAGYESRPEVRAWRSQLKQLSR